ncbi:hypothetical protein QZH41_012167, partial [Actinostola sp. cb2023]
TVVTPNGLIAHLFGPIEGRRHDAFMLGVSGLTARLQRFVKQNGEPYVIYGDPAYGITRNIFGPIPCQLANYFVASLLINCHTCLYGSVTSSYFEVDPPSLDKYLSNV